MSERIERMNDRQFENFLKKMIKYIENKYNIVYIKKEKVDMKNKPKKTIESELLDLDLKIPLIDNLQKFT